LENKVVSQFPKCRFPAFPFRTPPKRHPSGLIP
jgi:hypothetical protein